VDLFFDITMGIGVAAGCGLRPFLPTILVGALASGDLNVDFDHTSYSFLQSGPFLLAVLGLLVVVGLLERRLDPARSADGPLGAAITAFALGFGALLFAGGLAQDGYLAGPGLIGGVICAGVAQYVVRGLFSRVRARLDTPAQRGLVFYADAVALVAAGAAVGYPTLGILVIAALVWLALSGRRRAGTKYAGLRVLR
jgi:hypothetical protein